METHYTEFNYRYEIWEYTLLHIIGDQQMLMDFKCCHLELKAAGNVEVFLLFPSIVNEIPFIEFSCRTLSPKQEQFLKTVFVVVSHSFPGT